MARSSSLVSPVTLQAESFTYRIFPSKSTQKTSSWPWSTEALEEPELVFHPFALSDVIVVNNGIGEFSGNIPYGEYRDFQDERDRFFQLERSETLRCHTSAGN